MPFYNYRSSRFGCGHFYSASNYNIIRIMSLPSYLRRFLYYQSHIFHPLTVFVAGAYNINACGVDTTVTKDIREFGNVFLDTIKYASKQMAKVVWKYFLRIYSCLQTKVFHFTPNICTIHWFIVASYKYCSPCYSLLGCIAEQFFLQLTYNEDWSCFPFEGNCSFATLCCFNCYILQLAYADACSTYSLY